MEINLNTPIQDVQSIPTLGGIKPQTPQDSEVLQPLLPAEVVAQEPIQTLNSVNVKQAVTNIAEVTSNSTKAKDLSDLLSDHPRVKFTSRLLVKFLVTDLQFEGIQDSLSEDSDIENVVTSGDSTLNFYSPFKNGADTGVNGFLRSPIQSIIQYLNTNNSYQYILFNPESSALDKLKIAVDKTIGSIAYSHFGSNDIVGTSVDEIGDEDYDDEDVDNVEDESLNITVDDVFSMDSWNSVSFDDMGVMNVNYTLALSIHAMNLYDSLIPAKTLRVFKKMLRNIAGKYECSTLTIAMAVAVDTKMLVSQSTLDIIDTLMPHGEKSEYQFLTHSDVLKIVEYKEEALELKEDSSEGMWDEFDEFFPTNQQDINKLVKPSEMLFFTSVLESMDSQALVEDSE